VIAGRFSVLYPEQQTETKEDEMKKNIMLGIALATMLVSLSGCYAGYTDYDGDGRYYRDGRYDGDGRYYRDDRYDRDRGERHYYNRRERNHYDLQGE
jgi:hypothetical protein